MKILKLAFFFVVLTSCSSKNGIYDTSYKGESNYKNFYVVDTIKLENPIIINCHGKKVVCSKELLSKVKIDKMFFNRPDVFILGVDLYYDLNPNDYKRYHYPDYGSCEEVILDISTNKDITAYKYTKESVRFILCLINANYYNKKHSTLDSAWYRIVNNDQKNSFYKIVYPLCGY